MKNINIMLCIFSLLSIVLLNADERCNKFGIGASKEFKHTQCHCKCDQHAQAGRGKCTECGHYRAPTVFYPKSKTQKHHAQRAARASSNS